MTACASVEVSGMKNSSTGLLLGGQACWVSLGLLPFYTLSKLCGWGRLTYKAEFPESGSLHLW